MERCPNSSLVGGGRPPPFGFFFWYCMTGVAKREGFGGGGPEPPSSPHRGGPRPPPLPFPYNPGGASQLFILLLYTPSGSFWKYPPPPPFVFAEQAAANFLVDVILRPMGPWGLDPSSQGATKGPWTARSAHFEGKADAVCLICCQTTFEIHSSYGNKKVHGILHIFDGFQFLALHAEIKQIDYTKLFQFLERKIDEFLPQGIRSNEFES